MGNLSESFGLSQLFTVQADIDITLQLRHALALVDIELLDHVVVAEVICQVPGPPRLG